MWALLSLVPILSSVSVTDSVPLQQGGAGVSLSDTETQTQTLILTPGQTAEIKLEAKPNDVILATVDSQQFDPAVQLQDKDGNVLNENDDIATGNQSAQIISRLTAEGDYKLVVSGFKGAAGGQFTIRTRRFNAPPITGPNNSADFEDNKPAWRSIQVKKNTPAVIGIYGSRSNVPTGFDSRGVQIDNRRDAYSFELGGRFIHESETDQEIYILVPRAGYKNYTLDYIPVKYESIEFNKKVSGSLPRSQAIIYRFRANAGDLLRTQVGPGRYGYQITTRSHKLNNERNGPGILPLDGQVKTNNQNTVFVRESGEFETLVLHSEFRAKEYQFEVMDYARSWNNANQSEFLPIGENLYYKWQMPLGVLLDLSATSSLFDINFKLMMPDGEVIANKDDEGESTNPAHQMLITRPGTYYLQVGSFGDGGGGQFTISRHITLPSEFSSGASFKVTNVKPELRLISAKKGEFFYLALEATGEDVRVQLFDPNGKSAFVSTVREPSGRQIMLINPQMDGNHLLTIATNSSSNDVKLTKVAIK